MPAIHTPVLLREVLTQLDLRPGLIVVDGTVGAGGHSREIIARIRPGGRLVGLDRDPMMLALAGKVVHGADVDLAHSSYRDLRAVLDRLGIAAVDRAVLDLGLSSDQLADRERGFGIDAGGRLDMRFDVTAGRSAAEWLQTAAADELAAAFREWGELPQAVRLAAAIVQRRRQHTFEATSDLLEVLADDAMGRSPHAGKSIAPQLFQAIRIAVNAELQHLQTFLSATLPACLRPGGRVAVISFHSVEDRIVKQALRPEQGWQPQPRKPIEASPAEARVNPRSRSARLRVAVRATPSADRS